MGHSGERVARRCAALLVGDVGELEVVSAVSHRIDVLCTRARPVVDNDRSLLVGIHPRRFQAEVLGKWPAFCGDQDV